MLSFISRARGRVQSGAYRKRHLRTAAGYSLLALSVITSFATLAVSLGRPRITAFQTAAPIAGGARISHTQIRQVEISSSDRAISSQFANQADVAQMVTKRPLAAGELIEMSDLVNPGASTGSADEMTVPLAESKAPIDQIVPGDYVQLIATIGSGSSATSRVVASALKVIAVTRTGSTFGQAGQSGADLLLSIGDPTEAVAIAQAETAGSLVGVKVSGANAAVFQGVFSLGSQPGQGAAGTATPPLIPAPASFG